MIAKFDKISGAKLISLLQFVHSENNSVDNRIPPIPAVKVKSISTQEVNGWVEGYDVCLELKEVIYSQNADPSVRVDPKHLLTIYNLLTEIKPEE